SLEAPSSAGEHKAPVEEGDALVPPPAPATKTPPPSGGVDAETDAAEAGETETTEVTPEAGATAAPGAGAFAIPSLPSSSCAISGVPPVLIPIYQRASEQYGLGPQGPAILAGINAIETGFGQNLGPSYAGAEGWMQFMPETWAMYGVDANGDGVKDPNNPEDAIFAAARYLSAAGMPEDVWGAIFAYNHADWYVEEVLANAGCYANEVGSSYATLTLAPKIQVFSCTPDEAWKKQVPEEYLAAFEAAAGRYELGKRGVWTLAAIARLESDFGRGMSKQQLRTYGPLGLDKTEWNTYAVDGDGDGRIRHADVDDSAATLARLMWSRGSIDAGVFTHNQAAWYV
ncbi:MAG TPA: lytic murein transglycosylase, partial [Solirubrobacterales bacterium]|nr:lytic murein transglycosylase [Solirubrobacterales bacterium]